MKAFYRLVKGYILVSCMILHIFIMLALAGYEVVITTPSWWIEFLRYIGFVVTPA